MIEVINWLKKGKYISPGELQTDIHSHLLAGIDDGVQTWEESLEIINIFIELGYTKLITTPHILQDYYPNTPEIIKSKLSELKKQLREHHYTIQVDAAAEYFLDEFLLEKINKKKELLLIQNKYILFEMAFMTESPYLKEFIFKMKSIGITPILAHAERYSYYFNNIDHIEDIMERGALIQININSLTGYYTKPVRKLAEQLIDKGMVHLLGSDCHRIDHILRIKEAGSLKYFEKALNLPLLNRTL